MDIERETLVEIVVSVAVVGSFVVLVLAIGAMYNQDGFSEQGAFALVGSIVLFVLVMTGIGFWFSRQYE